ncbi:Putative reactive intermediate deaminase TdcF [Thalassovita gelatinovora]|uniref:Putative reactive intermediate deaminase TdcF n=1 Tax=Thalassovita gelatinovora TaxID=53501 RepID=A0A0P1F710_THAGE|nr:Rid family hydrolase [Thalassovita gelatinovora]QIZ79173.1 RidA family protein [Thalassovita gelatinovora]CUH63638.1 Putative reactive intermediate deaminase TdcF [Thalassovita gelatinovora]SER00824.1 Enamine deaminase RidA, house cleaning of reactive enamine intermediates, YjgF/YER057c/UK114 family [Thalassovita gelatinovora]
MTPLVPKSISAPFGNYSHGIAAGPLVATSGQLGLKADGTIPQSVTEQAEVCFAAIGAILAEDGLDFSDVVRFSAFVTKREDMAPYMAVRDRICADLAVKPASTLVIVSGFTKPEFLVEIEALALRR